LVGFFPGVLFTCRVFVSIGWKLCLLRCGMVWSSMCWLIPLHFSCIGARLVSFLLLYVCLVVLEFSCLFLLLLGVVV